MSPFDFGKHVGKKAKHDLTDPLALFEKLDRKTSHTTLRPAQEAALKELNARRKERDAVLKMPTGTGKSTVGLLYLRAKGAELRRAVVYLCPTIQLVEQVLAEAKRLGITAHHYAAGQPHPEPECESGEAVTVCTYDKLFNAKTTFERSDVDMTPAAIVLDDAHAGVEEVRDAFALTIRDADMLKGLHKILDGPAKNYSASRWEDIKQERPGASSIEIPYWSWRTVAADVRELLAENANHGEIKFVWPHLAEILPWCRCVVAPTGLEIAPPLPPVESVRPYREATHRLFMSATLADDAVLVRELGCASEAALKPVAPAPGTFGERLVLVPSLISKTLNLDWVQKFCASACKKWNVVVLCASSKEAHKWEDHGARVVLGNDVSEAVRDLRRGKANFVVFANRYDGVDLPDDACRILVLDGLPVGQGIADSHDGSIRGAFQHRMAYRIEQGMGRAVRSNADYAVVVLAGPGLASFTAKPEVRAQMSPDARSQIELAHELPKLASDDGEPDRPAATFVQMVNQCLSRSPGWRNFYDERVRAAVASDESKIDKGRVALADAERRAAVRAFDGNPADGHSGLQAAVEAQLSAEKVKGDRRLQRARAYYLQALASLLHDGDPGRALQLQQAAHDLDPDLLRAAAGAVKRRLAGPTVEQPAAILRHYETFEENPNAFLAQLESLKPSLSFEAEPHRFEQALKDLGPFLGAEALRPEQEFGEGPDNLLVWTKTSLVIEAKNEAGYAAIPKKDAEQLLHSMRWFEVSYPALKATGVPVMVVQATKTGKGVHLPEGARIMTPDLLEKLLAATTKFASALAQKAHAEWTAKSVFALLNGHALTPERLVATFTQSS